MRNVLVGLVLLTLVPAACGDTSPDDDDGNDAGAGGSAGEGATGGASGASGASPTGGRGGSSGGGTGATAGDGEAGMGGEPGTGGTGMDEGGEAGMGGEPGTGGTGVAGGGMGGSGMAGRGMSGAGMGGAGNGGSGTAGGGKGGTGGVGVETNCSDGMDNDSDAFTDCTDSDCALICSLGTCPAGTSPAVYSATGLPVAIVDAMPTSPAFTPITVATTGLFSKVSAEVGITHTFTGDLTLQLVTPIGTRVLSNRRGGGGDNFTGTVFSDSGTTSISTVTLTEAPFTGTFRPEQELAALSGLSLAGTWGLRAADNSAMDTGQITRFSVAVCQCLSSSGSCEFGPVACENRIDDDGDGLIDCQEAACASSPSCPAVEHACGDGVDNDGDNLTDCADPSCAWACTALGGACTGANRIFTYSTRSAPQTIGETIATFAAPIYAASRGTIVSAAVRFNAAHTFVSDLDLTLTSPTGARRILSDDNGAMGANYTNTIFIDSAPTAITAGTAPFTGSFRPEEPLSTWVSQQAVGLWGGELADDAVQDGGTLNELSLGLCVTP